MRAKSKIYHIECFRCCACARQLVPGDEFALRDGGALYCKEDHDVMEKSSIPTGTPAHPTGPESNNNTSLSNNNHSNVSADLGCMSGTYLLIPSMDLQHSLLIPLDSTYFTLSVHNPFVNIKMVN